ncbi:MAG: hypothetical protein JXP73_17175 [Deltaproteobacteria bacterium]|jgi:hypothetical protein|nr:hypothetical protein [Deltaproteobacteria bacterium]
MNDLESRAKAIVEAGREADAPKAADRDRIKRAVLMQIVAGGAVASSAAASTLSLGAKVGLAVLAVSVVGGGTVGVLKVRSTRPAVEEHVPAAAKSAPAVLPEAIPAPEEQPAPEGMEDTTRKAEPPRKPAAPGGRMEKTPEDDQLNAEVAVLKQAREELRLGRPARALQALVEYDRRFGQGVLGEERQAMVAIATCQAKPGPGAWAQAEAFMREAPASPLRERVREACITPARAKSP